MNDSTSKSDTEIAPSVAYLYGQRLSIFKLTGSRAFPSQAFVQNYFETSERAWVASPVVGMFRPWPESKPPFVTERE